ncbi:hypothetical protein C922_04252 [Plasmodium inui San Antonio 1]|uniref:Uncharacterized protein n=1 Tax=Plasmodium inui San Antonio 1 TaxID=1237626 RepID=W7A848_9APIC|nr:hypothetical protein C922_04252 [Plasmodium inui San Antonio 1]EUD65309.1 hypothetical protein C922_04252 [Plasmodium inui San Antonio 1]
MRERIPTKADKSLRNDHKKGKLGSTCSKLQSKKSGNHHKYSSSYNRGDTNCFNRGGGLGHCRGDVDKGDDATFFILHNLKENIRNGSTLAHGIEKGKRSPIREETVFPTQFGSTDDENFLFGKERESRKNRHEDSALPTDRNGHWCHHTNGYHKQLYISDMYSCDGNFFGADGEDAEGVKAQQMGEWSDRSKGGGSRAQGATSANYTNAEGCE